MYGFSVLPAGFRLSEFVFNGRFEVANFWTSTEIGDSFVYEIPFHFVGGGGDVSDAGFKDNALSVRCLKDSD